jgi:hypothetical protein
MAKRQMAHRRRCRGPRLGLYIQRQEVDWVRVAKVLGDTSKITPEKIHAMKTEITQRFGMGSDGPKDRLRCGFDVTSLMEEVPWDGQQHFVECPKCGQKCGVRHEALDPIEE